MKFLLRTFFAAIIAIGSCQEAFAALALDSNGAVSGTATGGGTPVTASLTTANTGEILLACIAVEATNATGAFPTIGGITGGGTWALRNRAQYHAAAAGNAYTDVEIWWTYASSALSGQTISVSISGTYDDIAYSVVGVTGFTGGTYSINPWDQPAATAAGFIATNTGSGGASTPVSAANVSTVNANAMLVSCSGSGSSSAGQIVLGTFGGTSATNSCGSARETAGTNASVVFCQYLTVSSTQSSITVENGISQTTTGWAIMPDALSQTGGGSGGSCPVTRSLLGVGC